MEAVAKRLPPADRWTYLCGVAAGEKPTDVVVRAFDAPALVAVGDGARGPDVEPVLVPAGQGRRVVGAHVYARPADPARPGRVSYRGV